MEIHITYETLFDMLRKERSLEDLQRLDSEFWTHVIDYLKDRSSFMEKTSMAEQEKIKIQLKNIKRILKEIFEYRERKIMNLAVNVVKTDSVLFADTKTMLAEERSFFEEQVALLTKYKKGVLVQVCNHEAPDVSVGLSSAKELVSQLQEKQKEESDADERRQDYKKELPKEVVSEEAPKGKLPGEQLLPEGNAEEKSDEDVMVKFTSAVPKFMGKNKQVFGPFDEGAITSLPQNIVSILLKKNKVEKVMAE